jgi:5-hydroxyisourate hydrolase-like protein (transthyretin family)
MKTKILWLGIFICVLLVGVETARACSCVRTEKPTIEFRKTSVVFVGTVKSVTSVNSQKLGDEFNFNNLRTTFSVDEALKGVKGKEIDIYTSSPGGGSCGIEFQEGEQYLVYAYDGGSEEKKYFSTSVCSRTRPAEGKDDEIAVLRSLAKGRFEPRIYGRVEEIMRGIFLLDRQENVPLTGIKITARNSTGGVYQSVTDKNGMFRFVNVKPGNYRLELKLPATHKLGDDSWGFIEKQKTDLNFTVTGFDAPDFITIETRVDGRIKGRVLDFQGNPVGKGVRVTLVTKDTVGNPDDNIHYIGTDTDKKGFYEFEGIPEGEYYLGVNLDLRQPYKDNPYPKIFYPNAGGFQNAALIKLGYAQKLNGFDINLPEPLKTFTVKGKVTKTDGSPAVGITVYVSNQARHNFEDFVWLKTDRNGEFTATCLEGVTYRFAVYEKDSKGFDKLSSEKIQKIGAESNQPLEFVIEK